MARWLALIAITQQVSCSGGSGGGAPSNGRSDAPTPVAVSISPSSAQIAAGASVDFIATVQNATNLVVNWQVNGLAGGNSAPSASVSISPSTANVVTGNTLQFSATVQNSTAALIWEVNGISGGNSTIGTIASTMPDVATYTAPANVPSPASVTITAALQTDPSISGSAGVTVIAGSTFTGVYSWRNDNGLTGQNPQETKLTPANVGGGQFGKLFGCAVDGAIFAQPLYVANVAIPSQGTHNVVHVATEHDSVYAFDADSSSCLVLWRVSFINPAMNVTTVPAADITGQTDIVPEIGITGTPVIDASTATLYVVSKTKVNQGAAPSYVQELHALDLATGAEKINGPAAIQAVVTGTGAGSVSGKISFDSLTENQRSALLLAGGSVYVAFDSYDDTPPFHGWLFAYNAADLSKGAVGVFISTPNGSNSNGGIGESGAAPSSDANGNVFVVTSDGDTFDANSGGNDYPETLLKLRINSNSPAFTVGDYFAPWNEFTLNLPQKHFGSTGVLLLPIRREVPRIRILPSQAAKREASTSSIATTWAGSMGQRA